MRALLLALVLTGLTMASASAAPQSFGTWRIKADHWSPADEAGFGRFVTAIGDSGCSSSESCLRSSANPWAGSEDRGFLDVDVDCAKLLICCAPIMPGRTACHFPMPMASPVRVFPRPATGW